MAKAPSPTDFTGRQKAKLEAEHAAEVAEAQQRMATIAAAVAEVSDEVIDMTATGQAPTTVAPSSPDPDEDDIVVVEPEVKFKEMRVNTDIDNMTLGAGNHYTFKMGQKYKVTSEVYDWLDEQGYVWH